LLTKSDLTPLLGDFSAQRAERHLRELASAAPVIELSSRSGQGMNSWLTWLEQSLLAHRASLPAGEPAHRHAMAHSHG
jgi:hydrogenase nickel incorporation protein HypB